MAEYKSVGVSYLFFQSIYSSMIKNVFLEDITLMKTDVWILKDKSLGIKILALSLSINFVQVYFCCVWKTYFT